MPETTPVEDMRSVDPVGYIRAVGLRPEDCYGFLPLEQQEGSSHFFLYRDRPEYEPRRINLPGPELFASFGGVEIGGSSADVSNTELPGPLGGGLADIMAQAQQAQQQWAGQGIAGGPDDSEEARIERIDNLVKIGAITAQERDQMVSELKGGDAGPTPGGVDAAPAAANAPQIVCQRIYPGLRMRSSNKQLDDFMPRYRKAVGLRPEDVYGVYPRFIRSSGAGADEANTIEWDDFWVVYRDRDEYAQGREDWAKKMNDKGKWPAVETFPGVAEAGTAEIDDNKVETEKDLWPRELMVRRKRGTDLGDALRKKIGKWDYEPEDSFGFCPSFANESIYFAWRKR